VIDWEIAVRGFILIYLSRGLPLNHIKNKIGVMGGQMERSFVFLINWGCLEQGPKFRGQNN